jgi:hypothetical protein
MVTEFNLACAKFFASSESFDCGYSHPSPASSRNLKGEQSRSPQPDTTTVGVPAPRRSSPAKCEACAIFVADAPGPRRRRHSRSTGPKPPIRDKFKSNLFVMGKFAFFLKALRRCRASENSISIISTTLRFRNREISIMCADKNLTEYTHGHALTYVSVK